MASKNLKKVLRIIEIQHKEFHPTMNPVSWNKAVKYIKAKDKRTQFNGLFRPLYAQLYKEMVEEGCVNKEAKRRAKAKAKEMVKAQLAVVPPAQSGEAQQETV